MPPKKSNKNSSHSLSAAQATASSSSDTAVTETFAEPPSSPALVVRAEVVSNSAPGSEDDEAEGSPPPAITTRTVGTLTPLSFVPDANKPYYQYLTTYLLHVIFLNYQKESFDWEGDRPNVFHLAKALIGWKKIIIVANTANEESINNFLAKLRGAILETQGDAIHLGKDYGGAGLGRFEAFLDAVRRTLEYMEFEMQKDYFKPLINKTRETLERDPMLFTFDRLLRTYLYPNKIFQRFMLKSFMGASLDCVAGDKGKKFEEKESKILELINRFSQELATKNAPNNELYYSMESLLIELEEENSATEQTQSTYGQALVSALMSVTSLLSKAPAVAASSGLSAEQNDPSQRYSLQEVIQRTRTELAQRFASHHHRHRVVYAR